MRALQFTHLLRRPQGLLLLGAALLAAHPVAWLISTWREPTYNPQGFWVAFAVACIAAWSYTSEQLPGTEQNRRYAYALLVLSASVRLVGQVLRVNVIGALTLALDVYALGTLAGLRQRRHAASPFWLAVLFSFSLPLERVVQRLIGFGLQQLSASGACGILGLVTEGVQCAGQRILLAGQDLLVDLPCSGARGLMQVLMLFAAVAAVKRPRWTQALPGLAIALAAAVLANMLRITALALGLAYPPGVNLMDAPWHELLGLVSLAIAAAPVALWAHCLPASERLLKKIPRSPATPPPTGMARPYSIVAAASFVLIAIVITLLPARPVDVARRVEAPQLPAHIGAYNRVPQTLTALERSYFAQFGGGATRASYGPFGLLMVSTSAPLRHLHAPDECLRGAGHEVRYVGLAHGDGLSSAIYRSTDREGQIWRVSVSYVSARGIVAASVAEAVWRWLQDPGSTWTMVQRIAPWDFPDEEREAWDTAVLRAFDLPSAAPQSINVVSQFTSL